MRLIRIGIKPEERAFTCSSCRSVFAYNLNVDIQTDERGRYVTCPLCYLENLLDGQKYEPELRSTDSPPTITGSTYAPDSLLGTLDMELGSPPDYGDSELRDRVERALFQTFNPKVKKRGNSTKQ